MQLRRVRLNIVHTFEPAIFGTPAVKRIAGRPFDKELEVESDLVPAT